MGFQCGIDHLLNEPELSERLKSARVGLVAHPASVTSDNQHSLDALVTAGPQVVKAFGPQHGMRGDKQDNMIESAHYADPFTGLTVHSLYSEVRKPTPEMLEGLDALVFDLQDVGVRVYTFIWTMLLAMEACAEAGIRLIEVDGSWDRKKESIEELVR